MFMFMAIIFNNFDIFYHFKFPFQFCFVSDVADLPDFELITGGHVFLFVFLVFFNLVLFFE